MFCRKTPVETFSSAEICLARRLESSGRPYVLHELLADWSDVLREGGAEHHHLLLVGSRAENLLHVAPHVCNRARSGMVQDKKVEKKLTQLLEHLVALIQDEVLQVLQRKLL